jgi:hypothetical protein
VDGLHFYRTPESKGALAKMPVLNQVNVIDGLAKRLAEIIPQIKPDVLHAHSPSLNAIAALHRFLADQGPALDQALNATRAR